MAYINCPLHFHSESQGPGAGTASRGPSCSVTGNMSIRAWAHITFPMAIDGGALKMLMLTLSEHYLQGLAGKKIRGNRGWTWWTLKICTVGGVIGVEVFLVVELEVM